MRSIAPGERIGAYRVIRLLGRGGMGVVYEATHEQLGTRCALKVFDTESGNIDFLRKRFLAEGKMLARLKHPRIVHVFDLGVDEATNTLFFAMDLILSPIGTPKTLEEARNEGVTEIQVEGWLKDICEGLDYIHDKGIVHRDVKLENVLIGPDGHAMISDFGIARIFDEEFRRRINLTFVTKVDDDGIFRMGTGMYMAPELRQRDAKATPASDAWSLGVLLFRLLTGVWYEQESRLLEILDGYERPWKSLITRLCDANLVDRVPAAGLASLLPLLSVKERRKPRKTWLLLISAGFAIVMCALCWLFLKSTTGHVQAEHIQGKDGEDVRLKAVMVARLNDIKKEASTRAKSFRDHIQKEISKCEEVTAEASKYLVKVSDGLPGYLKPLETQELLEARAFASGTSASREVKRELPECPTLASRATLEEVNEIWRKAYSYEARVVRVERLAEEIAKAVDSAISADSEIERSLPKMNLALSMTTSQLVEMRELMQQPQGTTILEMRFPWTYVSKMCETATDHFRSRFLPAVKAFEMKTFQDGLILTKYIGGADRFDVPSEIDGKRVLKIGGGNFERFSAAVFGLKWIRNSANINLKHGGVWNKYASTDFSKQVALHDGLRIIGKNAFCRTEIYYAVFPEGLCAIGDGAFQGCERLTLVGMPASLKYIGEQTFKGCNNLRITFNGNAPFVHANAFENVPSDCIVYVRRGSKGWNVPIPGTWKGLRIEYTRDSATTNDVLQKKSDVSAKVFADEVAPTNGLVAYYPFNGDTKDASGNGNHGINHGAVLAKDRYGRPDGAYYFSCSNGMAGTHIEVADSASLNSPSNAVTVSAWIRSDVDWYVENRNGKQSWLSVVCKGRTKRQYGLQIDAGTQKIWLMVGDRSCRDAIRGSSNCPKRGEWYHVAMTYDGTKQVAYLDGEPVGHKMSKGQLDAAGEPLFIGRDTPGEEEFFKGAIDDVRIYNRALSEYEISILFLSELAGGDVQAVAVASNNVNVNIGVPNSAVPRKKTKKKDNLIESLLSDYEAYSYMGTYKIKKYLGKDEKVRVPLPVGGYSYEIGRNAFRDNKSIKIVSFPSENSLMCICENAFAGCDNLLEINLPSNVYAIGSSAFAGCSKLRRIDIPSSLWGVGHHCFSLCHGLEVVNVRDLKAWCDITFESKESNPLCVSANHAMSINGELATRIIIPHGVKQISSYAFFNAALESVVIPASVEWIGTKTFACDVGLVRAMDFYFQGNAPRIESDAFENISSNSTVHVLRSSTGWGVEIPGRWNGMRIEYSDSGDTSAQNSK